MSFNHISKTPKHRLGVAIIFWLLFILGGFLTWTYAPIELSVKNTDPLTENEIKQMGDNLAGRIFLSEEGKLVTYRFTSSSFKKDSKTFAKIADEERTKKLANALSRSFPESPPYVFGWSVFWVLLIGDFVFICISYVKFKLVQSRQFGFPAIYLSHSFEFHLIGSIFLVSIFLCFELFSIGVFTAGVPVNSSDYKFWISQVNIFSLGSFILALTAGIYTVYTKVIADNVNDNTNSLQKTVAGFFTSFSEAMDENVENSIPDLIGKSKKSIVMYVGNPLVGYFRDEGVGVNIANILQKKLEENAQNPNFEFKLMCWGDKKAKEYLSAKLQKEQFSPNSDGTLPREDRINLYLKGYFDQRDALYNTILKAENSALFHHDFDPPFRFMIVDDHKAILWVLENPTASGAAAEASNDRPRAGGFKTELGYMVTVLDGVFMNASKDVNKVSTEDNIKMGVDRNKVIRQISKQINVSSHAE